MSDKQIIDAEFQVTERRLPAVRWSRVVQWVFWTTLFAAGGYVGVREGYSWAAPYFVVCAALQIPVARAISGLVAPRLSPEEVEPYAERSRASVRPWLVLLARCSRALSFRRDRP